MGQRTPRRDGEPSIHEAALDNLRRGAKPVLIFLSGLFGLMALYVVGGLVIAQNSMPTVPDTIGTGTSGTSGTGTQTSATPASSASATGGDTTGSAAADAWRSGLVAFLSDAVKKDSARWFPGATAETDGLTYTPLSPDDPGTADRHDGLARVFYHDLPDAEAEAALGAVSRDGKVDPADLDVTGYRGTDDSWTLTFTVGVRGTDAPLGGEAEGYTTPSGATVILRLVYPKGAAGSGG
ncbi:hypothetical protein OG562_23135 [Streptomyces sp. NBC_01275]|uniref:hypothetical protein n=1 Tax=Streptomyces sp. NBC_01275 TaxID=2903807 RepID=UPI002251872C|nr:hypothetical protein [Streptomyces sp. NBC_01275]MCX4763808.1 hypothetical protein [Streptomyces sp. NBC_01275]